MDNKEKNSKMDVIIYGGRQTGKTTFLVDSMFTHITDMTLPAELAIVGTAANITMCKNVADRLIKKLKEAKFDFSYEKIGSVATITINKRTCMIVLPFPNSFIGKKFDYVFLDNYDYFTDGFKEFIDTVIRPNVVVIQTSEEESPYMKDIKCKDDN